jgi:hypothetical protein
VRTLENRYDIHEGTVLGRGACGSVVAVRHRQTGELFAMKVISLDTVGGSLDELKREIEIQRTLDHPNICKIFESYQDDQNQEMFIIMEICTGGSLVSRGALEKGAAEAARMGVPGRVLTPQPSPSTAGLPDEVAPARVRRASGGDDRGEDHLRDHLLPPPWSGAPRHQAG